MTEPPFFIVGCPRSGTTLLQVLLDAHPGLAIPAETHIFKRFHFDCYQPLDDPRNLLRLSKDLLEDDHVRMMGLAVPPERFVAGIAEPSVRGVLSHLFRLFAEKEGARRWGEKTPQHALHLFDISAVFPEARFVHIVRDGRDVAASCANTVVGPESMLGVARMWSQHVEAFDRFSRTLDEDRYIEVRYEELAARPGEEVAKVFAFLGEEPPTVDQEVPSTARRSQYLALDVHMRALGGDITTRNVGRFRTDLTDREVQLFEWIGREWLERYGYEASGLDASLPPSRIEVARSRLADLVKRYWRKYVRPSEIGTVWTTLRRELQYHVRTTRRCLLRKISHAR